jgi:hypothetical protein
MDHEICTATHLTPHFSRSPHGGVYKGIPYHQCSSAKMPIPTFTSSEMRSNSNIESNPVTDSSIPTSNASQPATNTVPQQKTEAEEAADRLYEERIEEEYAKREGGA